MLKLIRRQGSPFWQIVGTVGGVRIRESTGTAEKVEARQVLERRAGELGRGDPVRSRTTFAWAVNLYLDCYGDDRFLGPINEEIGRTELSAINATVIADLSRRLYPGRAPATVKRQLYVPVNAVLAAARRAGVPAPGPFKAPPITRSERPHADLDWIERVTAVASPHLAALIWVLFSTGARISEALRLTWEDIDLGRGEASLITAAKNRQRERRRRVVDLPSRTIAALAALPGERAGRVFRWTRVQSVYAAVRKACKSAGVPYRTTHEIGRHALATAVLNAGGSLKEAQGAGGWASARLVLEVYGHLDRSSLRDRIEEVTQRRHKKGKRRAKSAS